MFEKWANFFYSQLLRQDLNFPSQARKARKRLARLNVDVHICCARRSLYELDRSSAQKLGELGGEALALLGQERQVGGARRSTLLLENNYEQRLLDVADQAKLVGPTPSRKLGQVVT